MINFVVTGTGRVGTMFMAELLNMSGMSCKHEYVFSPQGFDIERARQMDADSSFCAVPYLEDIPKSLLLYRNPSDVFDSLLARHFMREENAFKAFIIAHAPSVSRINSRDVQGRTWAYLRAWNEMALPYATEIMNIERLNHDVLAGLTGIPAVILEDNAYHLGKVNHGRRTRRKWKVPDDVMEVYEYLESRAA